MIDAYWILFFLPISLCIGGLFSWNAPSHAKGYIILTRVGFAGLSFSIPFLFYEPLITITFILSVIYFFFTFIGFAGCLKLNIHPFFPSFPLYEIREKPQVPMQNTNSSTTPSSAVQSIYQSPADALALLEKYLPTPAPPGKMAKDIAFRFKGERISLSHTMFTTSGLFLFFTCNWSGTVLFSQSSAQKHITSYDDTPDITPSLFHMNDLLHNIFRSIGVSFPVFPIIVTTNPGIHTQLETSSYAVLPPQKLAEYIASHQPVLSTTEMQDFFAAIEPYTAKVNKR